MCHTFVLQLREDTLERLRQYFLRLLDTRPANSQTLGLIGLGDDVEMHVEDVLVSDLAVILTGNNVSIMTTSHSSA